MLSANLSAKTKAGVQQAFDELTEKIFDTPNLIAPPGSHSGGLSLTSDAGGSGASDAGCGGCVV